jgi:hypothetical protein
MIAIPLSDLTQSRTSDGCLSAVQTIELGGDGAAWRAQRTAIANIMQVIYNSFSNRLVDSDLTVPRELRFRRRVFERVLYFHVHPSAAAFDLY